MVTLKAVAVPKVVVVVMQKIKRRERGSRHVCRGESVRHSIFFTLVSLVYLILAFLSPPKLLIWNPFFIFIMF